MFLFLSTENLIVDNRSRVSSTTTKADDDDEDLRLALLMSMSMSTKMPHPPTDESPGDVAAR